MTSRTLAVAVAIIGVGVSCSSNPPPALPAPDFSPGSAGYALAEGDSWIEGSGFLRQAGGDVVSCAGETVWLAPDTPYFRWASELRPWSAIGEALARPDVADYVRVATCDVEGRFAFEDVPPGPYLAGTVVTWRVPGGPPLFIGTFAGGSVFVPVDVGAASTQTVAITR